MSFKINTAIKTALLPLAIALSPCAMSDSSVWKVSKGDNHLYVGGTVHLLPEDQFPLPVEFDKAYKASETIVFEVPDLSMESPEIQQMLIQNMLYDDGRTLETVLSKETYERLVKVCESYGLPLANFNGMKPSMVTLVLAVTEYTRLGMMAEGVDSYFEDKAIKDNKARSGLESIEYQIKMLSAMGEGVEDDFIKKSLDDLPKSKELMDKLLAAWRIGDMKTTDRVMGQAMAGYSPALYQNLLVKRNNNWLPKIEEMMATKEIEFILVGVAHLAGKDSVLSQLANKGYDISKI